MAFKFIIIPEKFDKSIINSLNEANVKLAYKKHDLFAKKYCT